MTTSEKRLLLWLTGRTKETFYNPDTRKLESGLATKSERLSNTACKLKNEGFNINVFPTRGEFWITSPDRIWS